MRCMIVAKQKVRGRFALNESAVTKLAMDKYSTLGNLRSLLRSMERDLGLDDLSPVELDVFLAAQNVASEEDALLTTTKLRSHELVRDFPPATYHRALKSLVQRGYLKKAKGAKAKTYILAEGK